MKVYEFPGAWGIPTASPFCLKLTTWLRIAGLSYESVVTGDPRKAPRGKLPYIVADGVTLGDSGHIIEHLGAKHGITMDDHLSAEQRTQAHLLRRTFEQSLYFAFVYLRWIPPRNWAETKKAYFGSLPPAIRSLVPRLARRGLKQALQGQGISGHTEAEINGIAVADLQAIASVLGERDYFYDEPSSMDAVAYGFLENIRQYPLASPPRDLIRQNKALTAYCERIRERCWTSK